MNDEKFDSWAVVEVFGHSRFAGRVTEQAIGGCAFVRIDVPELLADGHYEARPGFTKLFTQGAIFSITPCTEETARRAASQFRSAAMTCVDLVATRQIARVPDDDDSDITDYLERTRD